MLIKDIMNEDVDVINCDRSICDAAKMMSESGYGSLPVEKEDKMIGMITDRDITVRVVAKGLDPATTRVEDCMSKGIDWCYEDDEVEDLAEKMANSRHRRIPIVNREKRLVGIVSLGDLAASAGDSDLTHKTLERISESRDNSKERAS
jgi:CBS domain-containing protein